MGVSADSTDPNRDVAAPRSGDSRSRAGESGAHQPVPTPPGPRREAGQTGESGERGDKRRRRRGRRRGARGKKKAQPTGESSAAADRSGGPQNSGPHPRGAQNDDVDDGGAWDDGAPDTHATPGPSGQGSSANRPNAAVGPSPADLTTTDTARRSRRNRAVKPSDVSRNHRLRAQNAARGTSAQRSGSNGRTADAAAGGDGVGAPTGVPTTDRAGRAKGAGDPKREPVGGHDRGRAAHNRDRGANHPRMRTVRETSAGGLVVSGIEGDGEPLRAALIGRVDRRGRMMWSLPKGHIETGETAEQTAIREVAEETGIEGTVLASLGKIDYWFVSEGKRIHKTVHHYLMRFTGGELSDADYEVAEVAWVPFTDLGRTLTYSDERRLARAAEDVIADLTADPSRIAQSEADSIRTQPNAYEKAAAARNQRRNETPPVAGRPRRRRRGGKKQHGQSPATAGRGGTGDRGRDNGAADSGPDPT